MDTSSTPRGRPSTARSGVVVRGELAAHPRAVELAREVHRVHQRYATEAIFAFRLCPFLRDPATGFGEFVVMLDRAPSVETAREALLAATLPIVHLVYPLVTMPASPFERFAAALSRDLKSAMEKPPVQATFHPELAGDRETAHRMVGMLRRAPDPFVQFIPQGMEHGGTTLAGEPIPDVPEDPARANFEKLQGDAWTKLEAILADIRADRDRSYAPFVIELEQNR